MLEHFMARNTLMKSRSNVTGPKNVSDRLSCKYFRDVTVYDELHL